MTTPAVETVSPKPRGKRVVGLLFLALALVAGAIYGVPKARHALTHESTDDATVSSHVTLVSSRIAGVATEVLVEDNQYVEAGAPLVRVDAEPYQLAVAQRQAALAKAKVAVDQSVAALDVAKADLEQARNAARAQFAGLRAAWFMVATVQDLVRYQTASLRSGTATLRYQEANQRWTESDYERAKQLDPATISPEELDRRKWAAEMARQQADAARESLQQTRALLGLHQDGNDPANVPTNVQETFSGTQYAVAAAQQALANVGIRFDAAAPSTADLREKLTSIAVDSAVEQTPAVLAAKARVNQAQAALGGDAFDPAHRYNQPSVVEAQKELEEAELNLRYTQIAAPIGGFVSRRNVNPGTHLVAGQPLLSIRPLENVWIDANFKETQLKDLRIGQAVEIRVDAYPGRTFKGRVAGFSPGTGSVLSLLPPENATGNFVKVVQRLPVRIELTEPNPKDAPLFAGLSAEPEVDTRAAPTGPDAGQRLSSGVMKPLANARMEEGR
jgi:membrane fusion protein (multidrug efflux system)